MKQKPSIAAPVAAILLVAAGIACAQTQSGPAPNQKETAASPRRETSSARAARALELVRDQPPLLTDFLARMPKGGDLHNHLSGAVYAESLIEYAAQDGLCVDPTKSGLEPPPCGNRPRASLALTNANLRDQLIDAWSMRNFHPTPQDRSGHDHFFATFGKFGPATGKHTGDMLAEVAHRAAVQQELYVETMFTPDAGEAAGLGTQFGWNDNLSTMRSNLLEKGMAQVVARGRQNIDEAEKRMKEVLGCEGSNPDAGCSVTVRYLYQVSRAAAKPRVFAQLVAGFEMAGEDPRVVGLNIVQPEDDPVALSNFGIEMQMLDYLHGAYPKVHISLHAGELAPGLVRPQDLSFHIRDSVEKGHAERIGHGVDVMQERDPRGLLAEMAQHHVLVEICLTSNDAILGVRGRDHPFPVYLHAGVPVALATDDEGVARSELTWEFERAVETYHLDYATLKHMVRDSLDHSFLPGSSLWSAPERFTMVGSCQGQTLRSEPALAACRRYLDSSERARIEWKEEVEFNRFEAGF
ncbi:MAG TPA: adenosine deaminase [Terriglobia bacterium]|nr:adenosine deaminase [Terriglobia bacterium]